MTVAVALSALVLSLFAIAPKAANALPGTPCVRESDGLIWEDEDGKFICKNIMPPDRPGMWAWVLIEEPPRRETANGHLYTDTNVDLWSQTAISDHNIGWAWSDSYTVSPATGELVVLPYPSNWISQLWIYYSDGGPWVDCVRTGWRVRQGTMTGHFSFTWAFGAYGPPCGDGLYGLNGGSFITSPTGGWAGGWLWAGAVYLGGTGANLSSQRLGFRSPTLTPPQPAAPLAPALVAAPPPPPPPPLPPPVQALPAGVR